MRYVSKATLLGICLLASLGVTALFTLAAASLGTYTQIDITIGTTWFFTISFITSMPLLIPKLRKRLER